jgi:hypothetical protein
MCDRTHLKDSDDDLPTWATLFPEGRYIYYEGDDPIGFIKEIKEKFGFDLLTFGFLCPPEHLDAIYSGDYPVGS